ncbi:MAG: hypothetical protein AAGA80_17825 [Cyanobacteria bacterium P01_F01_bin.143]
MGDQFPEKDKKELPPLDLDNSSERDLKDSFHELEKSRVETENKLLISANTIISILTCSTMIILIGLTINRDLEKDKYIDYLRSDTKIELLEKSKLIQEANDSFHRESINRFYNIFVALSAYFLGANANRNKK